MSDTKTPVPTVEEARIARERALARRYIEEGEPNMAEFARMLQQPYSTVVTGVRAQLAWAKAQPQG